MAQTKQEIEALRASYANYRWKHCASGYARFTDKDVCQLSCSREGICDSALTLDDADGKCVTGGIGHGPGHQSTTRCDVIGPHEIHHCVYGGDRQTAYWRGDGLKFSGFFDEPPDEEFE